MVLLKLHGVCLLSGCRGVHAVHPAGVRRPPQLLPGHGYVPGGGVLQGLSAATGARSFHPQHLLSIHLYPAEDCRGGLLQSLGVLQVSRMSNCNTMVTLSMAVCCDANVMVGGFLLY